VRESSLHNDVNKKAFEAAWHWPLSNEPVGALDIEAEVDGFGALHGELNGK